MDKRTLAVSLGFAAALAGGAVVGWLQESSPTEVDTASVPGLCQPRGSAGACAEPLRKRLIGVRMRR